MTSVNLRGTIPALIVPMRADYSIDYDAFRRYLEWVVSHGPVAVAVNVDTGENGYLTTEERVEVIRVARGICIGVCAVVAGIAGPGTAGAVGEAQRAAEAGADALLVFSSPAFLNDPLDIAIAVDYHEAIASASGLPLILFNLGRLFGGVPYDDDTLERLLELPSVVGLKDASFDAQRFLRVRDLVRGAGKVLLNGNDNFLLEALLLGADGGLLGFGAVGVGLLKELHQAVKDRDFEQAASLQPKVQGFCDFIYGRPLGNYRARCKVALAQIGVISPDVTYVRPPFQSLWDREHKDALEAVRAAGLHRDAANLAG